MMSILTEKKENKKKNRINKQRHYSKYSIAIFIVYLFFVIVDL